MIPNFALSLSFDGISLLRRMGPKWAKIEEVALDSANLDEGVRGLKTRALSLGPGGARVVLMIPNEQIRYIDLPDLGGDESTRETAIRAALEGATPYAVDDLKFDYALAPGRILVAAVAQDTLNEAEAFARSHGFNPASFAAQAPQGAFDGAVDFGRAPGWKGKEPERLPHAIQIVPANKAALTPVGAKRAKPGPGPKAAAAATPAVQDEPKQVEEPVVETLATPEAEDATPETPAATEAPETDATKAPEIPALRLGPAHRSAPAEPDGDTAEDSDNEAAPPSFSSQRRVPPAPKPISADAPMGRPEPKLSARKARFTPVVTPDSTARESNVNSGDLDAPDTTSGFGARANAVLDAMSRRRQKAQAPTQSDDAPETSKPALPKAPDAPAHARVEIPIPPKPPKEPAPSPLSELTARRLAQQPAESAPADGLALQSERERMTVFGARGDTAIGGKPKYLGLMLTSALLLFLVGVAAWASVFLDDGLASLFSRDEPDVAAVELPDEDSPTLPTLAPEPAPAAVPEPEVELAALDDGQVTEDVPQALAQPQLPQAMTEEEAAATYAATGIWQRAPAAPQEPAQSLLNDLYVASIDPGVQQLDAVALPDARGLSQEAALPVPTAPPPAGVVFTLDPRGLVVASPEGTLSPEGHRVYAGLPPVVPPLRDPVPVTPTAVPAPDAAAPAPQANNPLRQVRPEARPEDLLELRERATLGGISVAELRAIRPTMRPRTAQEDAQEAEPESPATDQAVVRSLAPVTRPRNMAAIVRRAEQARPQEVRTAAAVAPRTVTPDIPSAASVTRAATERNAINLNRVNLIGVYGKPSSRRALVRLANGQYKKVQVGDRMDGGRVTAIGESELRYSKRGRNVVLKMPRG